MPMLGATTGRIVTGWWARLMKGVFVVVYTVRHDTIRIISARKANQREIKCYENCTRED